MPILIKRTSVVQSVDRIIHVGVDPGAGGGVAAIFPNGAVVAMRIPKDDPKALHGWFMGLRISSMTSIACMERLTGYVGPTYNRKEGEDGDATNPGSSMFTMGVNYGMARMALAACDISTEMVMPRAWQAGLGIETRPKGMESTGWKNLLKAEAIRLFGDKIKVTKAISDALLIAEYCRRKYGGSNN